MTFRLLIIFLCLAVNLVLSEQRRIGVRHDLDISHYFNLGGNYGTYQPSENYPDLSVVGALISNGGALGTATLVAANYIVTAAHVMKNTYQSDPEPGDWEFVLHNDYGQSTSSDTYQVEEIILHPGWIERQEFTYENYNDDYGDGDILGIDIALVKLNRSVSNIYPARLPSESDDPLGLRTVIGGFGVLVNGGSGNEDASNDRLVGGENIIDRSIAKVSISDSSILENHLGGLLGIDFDSSDGGGNSLKSDFSSLNPLLIEARQLLESGDSEAMPTPLEASTAIGDSGGPAFVLTKGAWRVHGVVSYGTSDSSYGDVTLYTRLASHYLWLKEYLPNWADSKVLDSTGWLENPWLGKILPTSTSWTFHQNLGWLYTPLPKGNSFWGWSDLFKKWIWLSDEAFPFVYCHTSSQNFWLFTSLEYSNGSVIRAYDYSTSRWENFNGN